MQLYFVSTGYAFVSTVLHLLLYEDVCLVRTFEFPISYYDVDLLNASNEIIKAICKCLNHLVCSGMTSSVGIQVPVDQSLVNYHLWDCLWW
jgi:hypothetical protein